MTVNLPAEVIEKKILYVRGQKVMIDRDLAELYGVTTKRLNEQVKRNSDRFPEDFMFQLTGKELTELRSQIATSKSSGRGGSRYLPYAFTEHGAIMAATVLSSPEAIKASLYVVRAFVHLRELTLTHKELSGKLEEIERKVSSHDQAITGLIHAIRDLMKKPEESKGKIGFTP